MAVLVWGAAALARQLEADLLKLLLVVGPHELIEACGEGRGGALGLWVPGAAATTGGPPASLPGSRSTVDPGGPHPTAAAQPPGQDPQWAACAGQGTLEQAVLLGVLGKEGAEASNQGLKVIGALVVPQSLGEGVKAGLAQCLLHGHHEQLGPARVCAGCRDLLCTHAQHLSGVADPSHPQGQQAAVGAAGEDAWLAWPGWGDISPGNLDSSLCFLQPRAFLMMHSA